MKNRRGKNDSHARFYPWEVNSPAFQSLSCVAVRLLLELKMLHNGRNNGTLYLSVRDAAERMHVGKNQANQAFADLQDRGFIRPNVVGAFSMKFAARRGLATSWVLTEFPIGEDGGPGSRDFMRWTPNVTAAGAAKKIRRSPIRDEVSSNRGHTVPAVGTPPPKLSLVRGHFEPKTVFDGPQIGDTDKLPGGGERKRSGRGETA